MLRYNKLGCLSPADIVNLGCKLWGRLVMHIFRKGYLIGLAHKYHVQLKMLASEKHSSLSREKSLIEGSTIRIGS